MYNKTISLNHNWILIFICFVGRLLLEPSTSSSSSFIIELFLIQMLRWIRFSSRVEFFVFLIAWGIFFGWWDLDLPIFFSLTMSWTSSCVCSSWGLSESNHFLLAHIPWMSESNDPGRPFKVTITTSTFFTSSLAGFLRSYFDLCSSLQIACLRNQISSMSLGNTLVEQVYLRLNHQ